MWLGGRRCGQWAGDAPSPPRVDFLDKTQSTARSVVRSSQNFSQLTNIIHTQKITELYKTAGQYPASCFHQNTIHLPDAAEGPKALRRPLRRFRRIRYRRIHSRTAAIKSAKYSCCRHRRIRSCCRSHCRRRRNRRRYCRSSRITTG